MEKQINYTKNRGKENDVNIWYIKEGKGVLGVPAGPPITTNAYHHQRFPRFFTPQWRDAPFHTHLPQTGSCTLPTPSL